MNGSILIIARNCLNLTKLAVKSALAQDVPCDVMVIDNASDDGTSQWLRTKPVIDVSLTPQQSLAACWNRGLKAFFDAGATEILVLNNDVEIASDTYRLLSILGGPFVTGVGIGDIEQFKVAHNLLVPGEQRPHPDFSCFMIRPEVFEMVGKFDEDYYPAYCEDCDYHVRMHRAGVNAVCVDLPFYHHASGTLKNASPAEQSRIRRGADNNRERFRKKYGCLPGSVEYQKLFSQQSFGT
jgi:GT2 family glycosyltransferase